MISGSKAALVQTIFVLHLQVEESIQKVDPPPRLVELHFLAPFSMFHLPALSLNIPISSIFSARPLRAQAFLPHNCHLDVHLIMLEVSYTNFSPLKSVQILLLLGVTVPIFE